MGMPFPKGAVRVGELVDWGFAVNGAASVLGATGILLIAFTWGLSAALLTGAALYLGAFWVLRSTDGWNSAVAP
jgi:thiamine transporter ThiT